MLRCKDNSIYTGITTDINRRMKEHFSKGEKCAKYTLNHSATKLESVWQSNSRIFASKLEYHIKTLSKKQKEELITKNNLEDLLGEKIDCNEYKKYVWRKK
jgi:putative endonuclease